MSAPDSKKPGYLRQVMPVTASIVDEIEKVFPGTRAAIPQGVKEGMTWSIEPDAVTGELHIFGNPPQEKIDMMRKRQEALSQQKVVEQAKAAAAVVQAAQATLGGLALPPEPGMQPDGDDPPPRGQRRLVRPPR